MDDFTKLALGDIVARQKAQLDLLLHADRQAGVLFGFCLTIGAAAAAGLYSLAAAGNFAEPVKLGALAACLCLLIGSGFAGARCLAAVRMAKIAIPAREPEFWLTWLDYKGEIAKAEPEEKFAVDAFLKDYIAGIAGNMAENSRLGVYIAGCTEAAREYLLKAALMAALLGFTLFLIAATRS